MAEENNSSITEDMKKDKTNLQRGYKKKPLRCRLGLHKYGIKIYHEEQGSYSKHSIETCMYCGNEKKGKSREEWDNSRNKL